MCECGGVSFSELGRILHSWYTLQRSCLCAYVYRYTGLSLAVSGSLVFLNTFFQIIFPVLPSVGKKKKTNLEGGIESQLKMQYLEDVQLFGKYIKAARLLLRKWKDGYGKIAREDCCYNCLLERCWQFLSKEEMQGGWAFHLHLQAKEYMQRVLCH